MHNYLLHQKGGDKKKQEDLNLLGFTTDDAGNMKGGKDKEEIKFKDEEAIDFSWYFSPEYKVKEVKDSTRI